MNKAWMVRRDGKAYRMTQHVYGSLSHLTEASYAAEWLYKHTMVSETKHLCQEFLDTITDETDTSLKKQGTGTHSLIPITFPFHLFSVFEHDTRSFYFITFPPKNLPFFQYSS